MILDIGDDHWIDLFSEEELTEIRKSTTSDIISFPKDMSSFLDKVPKKTNIKDIFLFLNDQIINPYENRDLYWLKMSLQQTADLFITGYLPLTNQQERDIIKRVWGFIEVAYDGSELTFRKYNQKFINWPIVY